MNKIDKYLVLTVSLLFLIGLGITQCKADTLDCPYGEHTYSHGYIVESLPNQVYKFKTDKQTILFSFNNCVVEEDK